MHDNKAVIGFVAGIASSLSATALAWLLTSRNVQTAGFISILIAAVCAYLYWSESRERRALAASSVRFAQRVKGSEFEFGKMANCASRTIFMVGPNLNFIVKEAWVKDLIFSLMKQRNLEVRLLLTDPNSPACHVMNDVAFTQTFQEELTTAINSFSAWRTEAKSKALNFQVKKAAAITLSMVFVDAESGDGKVLVIPIPWRVNGSQRPCFMLEKDHHAESFSSYYESYRSLYENVAVDI